MVIIAFKGFILFLMDSYSLYLFVRYKMMFQLSVFVLGDPEVSVSYGVGHLSQFIPHCTGHESLLTPFLPSEDCQKQQV
jgi:hypothetical protein